MRRISTLLMVSLFLLTFANIPLLAGEHASHCNMEKACCKDKTECCKTADASCDGAKSCCDDAKCCKEAAEGTHASAMKVKEGSCETHKAS